ncbi:MAG: alanine--tRNA ligase [Flavobacteriales bacterium]
MTANEIRAKYLEFFRSKNHKIVPSAPMVIKNDPTLMFTNAGMNQFKDLFLGNSEIKHPRVADSQKCLRVSGKHNDLEEVGVDTYHHTMFEMLGNWSFGDYFKEEAISWAWELLTEVYEIPEEDLYISIFSGDEKDGTSRDDEARDIWKKLVSEDKILEFDKKDNFWEMGETGPCGPCSEIHVDMRSAEEKAETPGRDLVNLDHPQVVEIWNLVFMEYFRNAKGELSPLPAKHIDTGMGMERLVMALQRKTSNYDTDVFQPYIQKIAQKCGIPYGKSEKTDIAIRVIADHLRAVAFAIADGELPSNTGAGYVIRRILRRAIRYAFSTLEIKEAYIYELVEDLVREMGGYFGELKSQQALINRVIKEEEENFHKTLEKGIIRLETYMTENPKGEISGSVAFELYDTFGFPFDLTSLMVSENGRTVNEEEFKKELAKQKERSRAATKIEAKDWNKVNEFNGTEFIGFDQLICTSKIGEWREITQKKKTFFQFTLDTTPFYPEGGGQVGDTGKLVKGDEVIYITNTKKENNQILHFTEKLPTDLTGEWTANVNAGKRATTAMNHTSTHLMHLALRTVLGTHVEQKGSLVHPDYLRFDFSHFSKVTPEELEQVESMVNDLIRENIELDEQRDCTLEEAKNQGAMMLFGEKYGDKVRLIRFGESAELCGGTHVPATGSIGYFKITSEGAVASGVRRIEAISGEASAKFISEQVGMVKEVRDLLKTSKPLGEAVSDLQTKNSELEKEIAALKKAVALNLTGDLKAKITEVNGVPFLAEKVDLDGGGIKDLAMELKKDYKDIFLILASDANGKAIISCLVGDETINQRGLHAGQIIKELSKEIKGGGGGQAFFATAGGSDPSGIAVVLEKAKSFLD